MMLWLLLQAAAPADLPDENPLTALRGTVVAAIRNCGTSATGEIVVCSPDRGFAEGQRRLQKLKKPKPIDGGAGITLEVTAGTKPAGPERE